MSYAFNIPPKVAPTELEPGRGLMPKRPITDRQALEALDELEGTDPAGPYRCTACSWAGDTPSNCPKCAAEVTINDGVDVDRGGER